MLSIHFWLQYSLFTTLTNFPFPVMLPPTDDETMAHAFIKQTKAQAPDITKAYSTQLL